MPEGVFEDCYRGRLGSPDASPRALAAHALAAMPGWVGGAMWLRNRLVAPFGLKTGTSAEAAGTDPLAALPVLSETGDEFVTGLDDRHLDFRVRLARTAGGGFELSTRVVPHNRFGRLYLALVLPAHRIIMRRMARALSRPIEET